MWRERWPYERHSLTREMALRETWPYAASSGKRIAQSIVHTTAYRLYILRAPIDVSHQKDKNEEQN